VRLENIIRRLEERKVELALGSLLQPTDTTAFGYGEAVGRVRGLQEALTIIQGELDDEDRRERSR
jgi:hypothetical protein